MAHRGVLQADQAESPHTDLRWHQPECLQDTDLDSNDRLADTELASLPIPLGMVILRVCRNGQAHSVVQHQVGGVAQESYPGVDAKRIKRPDAVCLQVIWTAFWERR